MVALVGASGAGKTTLVRGILGLTPTTAGSVLFGDAPAEPLSVQQVFKHTTLLSQNYGRYELTVRENLLLGTTRSGAGPTNRSASLGCAQQSQRRRIRADLCLRV